MNTTVLALRLLCTLVVNCLNIASEEAWMGKLYCTGAILMGVFYLFVTVACTKDQVAAFLTRMATDEQLYSPIAAYARGVFEASLEAR